jgi:ABC-type dipeptide/oligopeptide/nickel transport system permease subunit
LNATPAADRRIVYRQALRRIGTGLIVLLIIAYLSLLGLNAAHKGRTGQPVNLLADMGETALQLGDYVFDHPDDYLWHKELLPAFGLVKTLFTNSLGLLLVSLGFATVAGMALGLAASLYRRRNLSPVMVMVSILGTSTPTFLLGMLLWVVNIQVMRGLGRTQALLPPTGLGWDLHMIMPALVLGMRPMAQIMQITYVNLSEIFDQDFIRVARAKGLSGRLVILNHAVSNIWIPVLTTLSTTLRYSLATLPVVESFFLWEGIGLGILIAIQQGITFLVTDLVVSLGLMFLLINLLLDLLYPLLDARLRRDAARVDQAFNLGKETWIGVQDTLAEWFQNLRTRKIAAPVEDTPQPVAVADTDGMGVDSKVAAHFDPDMPSSDELRARASRHLVRSYFTNPPLVIGTILVLAFVFVAFFGPSLTPTNPYETHNIVMIDGQVHAPPYPLSVEFPWGGDVMGRDVQALVFYGARQTLALALFGMLARMLLGVSIGMAAGWWQGSRFDHLVSGAVAVLAAFPVTIFSMILILALGIQQGMSVFIIAISLSGWGEIAQYVRGQVISIQPQLYIEAARAVGARSFQILYRHVLPILIPSVVVLTMLEMGGVLMLVADLGFLNIFLGGGFAAELISGDIYSYSDVPEWGSMLANIRNWWRSYPWLAWYPGMAFFISILGFNLWGEGLRRYIDRTQLNLSRLINRYTVVAALVIGIGLFWFYRSASSVELYRPQAETFSAENALPDIEALTSTQFQGRETGTDGNRLAAEYLAERMEEVGLFPAGEHNTYLQTLVNPRPHLTEIPRMQIMTNDSSTPEELTYREDFVEFTRIPNYGTGTGPVVALAFGPRLSDSRMDTFKLNEPEYLDAFLMLHESDLPDTNISSAASLTAGVLIVSENPAILMERHLLPHGGGNNIPILYISLDVAAQLLESTGTSLEDWRAVQDELQPGERVISAPGAVVSAETHINTERTYDDRDSYYNVIGFIPGSGAQINTTEGQNLDSYVILVSAYFDGLGVGPDGTLYPGAIDNSSSVATLLEIARLMNEGPHQPKKTVVFAAWSGGERMEGMSVSNLMNAKTGFGLLNVETVIELIGAGGGSGNSIMLGRNSSYRLVSLFQETASHLGTSTTTRGRLAHPYTTVQSTGGNRTALTIFVGWDGADEYAHTPFDTIEVIEPDKLEQFGETTALAIQILANEVDY